MEQEDIPMSTELYFYIESKLQYLRDRRGFGRIEIKVQDGLPHTLHFTESKRVPKRPRLRALPPVQSEIA